ncbi:MAG TPA: outer membrane protein assembly factor BamD [Ferruginibacter sp.]|jgi:outer membrane protein assembly factor BamD|nr:outer membrane protein assembly factor BamD [Ferruginibacter sp.]
MQFFKVSLTGFLFIFLLSSCNNYNKVIKSKDNAYKLKMADEYYAAKKYRVAQQLYEQLYPIYKGTDKFEEIYYRDAYCFYYLEEYKDAENFFKGFLDVFPNSPKAEEVDFMHAVCFYNSSPKEELDQTNTIKSIGLMQSFINAHPGSARIDSANSIIDKCRDKLEQKQYSAADLYYKIGQYRAAALSYADLMNDYPASDKGDVYKLKEVRAYFKFAKLSIPEKQVERYQKVITEYNDFIDKFPDSKLLKEAEDYSKQSQNNIKAIENEQTKTTTQR